MAETNWQTINLRTPDDWVPWYALLKVQATMWNVWQYIDPEAPLTFLPLPPVSPICPTAKDIKAGARSLIELNTEEQSLYKLLIGEYDRQLAAYNTYLKAVDRLG
jgi:hypothetical protein